MSEQPDAIPRAIQTARLRLEAWEPDDAPALRRALDECDAHLRPWIPFMRAEPRSLEQTRKRIMRLDAEHCAGLHLRYAMRTREDDALVGEVMLLSRAEQDTREVGYWVHHAHMRRGYAMEGASAMIELARAMPGVARVVFLCDPHNHASEQLVAKLGATLVETMMLERRSGAIPLHVWALALR